MICTIVAQENKYNSVNPFSFSYTEMDCSVCTRVAPHECLFDIEEQWKWDLWVVLLMLLWIFDYWILGPLKLLLPTFACDFVLLNILNNR